MTSCQWAPPARPGAAAHLGFVGVAHPHRRHVLRRIATTRRVVVVGVPVRPMRGGRSALSRSRAKADAGVFPTGCP
jgi:hypothetical protein